ncbi:RNA ligase [Streptosporangium roseum]|uniref:RNA ligase n=1 Tax=Streptosporangium roseum TaxID=2001 RepID=UPI00332C7F80
MKTLTRTHITDLLNLHDVHEAIEDGYVRTQVHPIAPLTILNYTQKTQYERVWDETTITCRGLIIDHHGWVLARPWAKFFNYGDSHSDQTPDLAAAVEVTDKADGSLGILYPRPGGWAIATRGSFDSDQARHATRILHDRYSDFTPPPGVTVLFEIVYPANRIVLDYGDTDDLILLGGVDIATGRALGPADVPGWPGPVIETFSAATLSEALAQPPRPNAEGLVIRFVDAGHMLKIKQADYLALHRTLTNSSARTIWEFLAVHACRQHIGKPQHWGSLIGLDPARAAQVLEVGPDWLPHLVAGVPDEFHAWIRETITTIQANVDGLLAELDATVAEMRATYGTDRRAIAAAYRAHPHFGALMHLYGGSGQITTYAWRAAYPDADKPWMTVSEDTA